MCKAILSFLTFCPVPNIHVSLTYLEYAHAHFHGLVFRVDGGKTDALFVLENYALVGKQVDGVKIS